HWHRRWLVTAKDSKPTSMPMASLYACFSSILDSEPLPENHDAIGIDVGILDSEPLPENHDANVYANGIVVLRQRFAIQDRGKAGVPLAVFILESERFNFALERTMQLDFNVANFGQR